VFGFGTILVTILGLSVNIDADVAIVGFGPVGAVMAGLLARHGVTVMVIEKESAIYALPRAAHIDHTGLRTIQELGCLDQLLPTMIRNKRLDLLNAEKQVLVSIPADQPSLSGLPSSVYFYQPEFDGTLRETVAAMPGVTVRLATEMIDLGAGPDGVRVRTRAEDGRTEWRHVRWLIGCDGAWSPVREKMGIKLDSLNFDEKWLVFDLVLEGPHASLPRDHVVEVCDPARPYLSTPISGNRQRFEFMLLPGEDPEHLKQPEEATRLLANWIPEGGYRIERAAIYTFHGLVAEEWRRGRVLIAGDAAHQTPPFLGQGMCAGIRDAANLAWKLASVIKGAAPDHLIDTYEQERKPHAVAVIEAAIRIGRVICELDPGKAAERDRHLLANDPLTHKELAFALPRLTPGPLILKNGGSLFVQPMIGATRLDTIVGGRFLVFARRAAALGNSADWWRDTVNAMIATPADLDARALVEWLDRHKADVVIVRPDRYVLGAAHDLDELTKAVKDMLSPMAAQGAARAKTVAGSVRR
jgi:3-(3-hydroxy-phenyl)propionate hydroxylase